jgi:tetratricopeptide (TPR) repeat protein
MRLVADKPAYNNVVLFGGEMSRNSIGIVGFIFFVFVWVANSQQPPTRLRLDAVTNAGQDPEAALKSYLDEIRSQSRHLGELEALYRSSRASEADSQLTQALEGFRKLYSEEPGNARGFAGIVRVYFAQKRYPEMDSLLQTEIDRQPNRMDIRLAFVDAAREMHEEDLAAVSLNKWLNDPAINPGARAEFSIRLALIYEQKGDTYSALMAISEANELRPGEMTTRLALARVLDTAGRSDEAGKIYRDLLGVDPNDVEALRRRVIALTEGGDLELAHVCELLAMRLLPNSKNEAAAVVDTGRLRAVPKK